MRASAAKWGFSVVELSAVLAIAGILSSMLLPAVVSIVEVHRRSHAVGFLLDQLEAARSAAISWGGEVRLIFWNRPAPDEPACLLVHGERRSAVEGHPQDGSVLRWTPLPRGLRLHAESPDSFRLNADLDVTELPGAPPPAELAEIAFEPTGVVIFPRTPPLGWTVSLSDNPSLPDGRVSLDRFTGRAEWSAGNR